MNFWETLVISMVTAASAYYGSYISNKRNINRDNISVQRERLLKNINKAEDYLHLLVELSFLGKDISQHKELVESLETNTTLLKKESSQIDEQISFLQVELSQDLDSEQEKEFSNQLKLISGQNFEILNKATEDRNRIKELRNDLDKLPKIFEDYQKRIIDDDIEPTLFMIDPSGEIQKYMNELAKIFTDQEKSNISANRIIELRMKINNLFTEKIRQIS